MRMRIAVLGSVALLAVGIAGAGPALAATSGAQGVKVVGSAANQAVASASVNPPAKPKPVRPASSPGATSGSAVPAKPARKLGTARLAQPAGAWSVSLSTNITTLWPTQYATLTATASADVGPTPYYIRIYDLISGRYVATCGFGTSCVMPVTNTTATVLTFVALISDASSVYPPGSVQATSFNVNVDWRTYVDATHITVDASANTVGVGQQSVITARTAIDITSSPFYILLIDSTTHNLHGACPSGTFCSVGLSKNTETSHMYVGFLASSWSGTFDPVQNVWLNSDATGVQATSAFMYVTWTNSGWRVSLTASAVVNGQQTITAAANMDVGPTPYYIEVFAVPFGNRVGICGNGSTCTFTITPSFDTIDLQAFVAPWATTVSPPPTGLIIQASSNLANV